MATTRTIIDVHNGRLSMTVLGEKVQLDVLNAMSLPSCAYDDCLLIDEANEDFCEQLIEQCRDEGEEAIAEEEVHTDVHETFPRTKKTKPEETKKKFRGKRRMSWSLRSYPLTSSMSF